MKKILSKIVFVLFISLIILNLSGLIFSFTKKYTSFFSDFPFLEKNLMHILILLFSVFSIFILAKKNIQDYDFSFKVGWFPILKVFIIALLLALVDHQITIISPSESFIKDEFSTVETILDVWILASISEEILFRGLILGYLKPFNNYGIFLFGYYISTPIIISASLFAIIHLPLLTTGLRLLNVLSIVFAAFILGILAGYYKNKSRSILVAIFIHFIFNFTFWLVDSSFEGYV